MRRIILDTSILIARSSHRNKILAALLHLAGKGEVSFHIPVLVWAEWLAGGPSQGLGRTAVFSFEPVSKNIAKAAGQALAELRLNSSHMVDATVMATAASLEGVVYTSDVEDMTRLQSVFSDVQVFRL